MRGFKRKDYLHWCPYCKQWQPLRAGFACWTCFSDISHVSPARITVAQILIAGETNLPVIGAPSYSRFINHDNEERRFIEE